MQIFSKLQRNSSYYIFIAFLIIILNLFNSSFIFFPVLLGLVFLCFDMLGAIFYIAIFSILHEYNIFYFEGFYLFYYFYLQDKILDYFDKEYFDVVLMFIVYFIYFLYLFKKIDINFLFIYIVYNFAFDLLISRILKCKVE